MQEVPGLFPGIWCFTRLPADTITALLTQKAGCLCRYLRVAVYSQTTEHFFFFNQKILQMLRVCGQCSPLDKSNEDLLHQGRNLNS